VNIHVDLISRIAQSYWQAKFTIANSKPSISVNKVDKSLSPTVTPPLEFPPGPVLQDHRSTILSYFVVKFRFSTLNLKAMIKSGVHMNHFYFNKKRKSEKPFNKILFPTQTVQLYYVSCCRFHYCDKRLVMIIHIHFCKRWPFWNIYLFLLKLCANCQCVPFGGNCISLIKKYNAWRSKTSLLKCSS
jgi:hypothetical protein